MDRPTIKLFKKIIPQHFIDRMLLASNYNRSQGYEFESKEAKDTPHRTSSTFFDMNGEFNDLRDYVLDIIKKEFGHEYSKEQCELFQLTKYDVSQFFKPHFDFFNVPRYENTVVNDRVATVIVYLKSATKGGATNFPNINLSFSCEPGDMVYFTYKDNEDKISTSHEGTAIEEGQKIIATLWIRRIKI